MVIGIYNFDIVCNLSIVIWDFSAVSGKANRFYLNQLELTLTNPCYFILDACQSPFLLIISRHEKAK